MKKCSFVICVCLAILSCGPNVYKAEDEIEYLQTKLRRIQSLAEEASYNIADLSEENEDAKVTYTLLQEIEEESKYREYNFYIPE